MPSCGCRDGETCGICRMDVPVAKHCEYCDRTPLSVCRNEAIKNNWELMVKISEPLREAIIENLDGSTKDEI